MKRTYKDRRDWRKKQRLANRERNRQIKKDKGRRHCGRKKRRANRERNRQIRTEDIKEKRRERNRQMKTEETGENIYRDSQIEKEADR